MGTRDRRWTKGRWNSVTVGVIVVAALVLAAAIGAVQDPTADAATSGVPDSPGPQYHAAQDEIVDGDQADTLHETYCATGVSLQFNTIISDHLTGIVTGNGTAHEWIVNRFNDAPAPSNC
ncbi:MAG: hypothetical protein QG608_3176 [Actinomycetota bacterium]|nr:hypothetical protein [Actinomycetota bacterium]